MPIRLQHALRALPIAAALVFVFSLPAHAHSGFAGMSDFWNGFLHLLIAPEQCITLLAIGLVMARLESDDTEAPFHLYLTGLAAGLLAGVLMLPAELEILRPAPLVLAGLLLIDPAERVRRVPRAAILIASTVAGISFGSAVPPDVSRFVFAGGMFLGAILFPTYAMVAWERLYVPWFRIGVRILGSWMAAIGIILVGAAFR